MNIIDNITVCVIICAIYVIAYQLFMLYEKVRLLELEIYL